MWNGQLLDDVVSRIFRDNKSLMPIVNRRTKHHGAQFAVACPSSEFAGQEQSPVCHALIECCLANAQASKKALCFLHYTLSL